MWHGQNNLYVSPDALQQFAWSAPMRDLAAKVGISDVGLKKILKAHGIVTPPSGHWNRVHAGRPVKDWTCNGFAPVTDLIMPPLLRTPAG